MFVRAIHLKCSYLARLTIIQSNLQRNYNLAGVLVFLRLVLWHMKVIHWRLFNAKYIFIQKVVLFQTIQSSISTLLSYIWSVDRALTEATTPGQSGAGSDGNEGTPYYPKIRHYWSFTLRLYSVIYRTLVGRILPLCRDTVRVFYCPSRLCHSGVMTTLDIFFIIQVFNILKAY